MSAYDRTDWFIVRATGPRREAPAVCYTCGDPVPDTPRFGNEATCDRDACRWKAIKRRPVTPWLAGEDVR